MMYCRNIYFYVEQVEKISKYVKYEIFVGACLSNRVTMEAINLLFQTISTNNSEIFL